MTLPDHANTGPAEPLPAHRPEGGPQLMAELTAAHARDVGDYVSLVRRRWTWVLGSVLVCAALATMFLSVAEQTFVSSSKVLVKSTVGTSSAVGDRTNDAINLDTEAQLVTSESVAERAGELLGSASLRWPWPTR